MPRRTRGLLRTVGRTAAIAGTATAVSNRVSRHQQEKFAKQQQSQAAPAAAAPHPPADDLVGRLQQLADLRDSGALNEREFAAAKARLLAG
jgi:hypothetical protein